MVHVKVTLSELDLMEVKRTLQQLHSLVNSANASLSSTSEPPPLLEEVAALQRKLPLMIQLKSRIVKPRHWKSISAALSEVHGNLSTETVTLHFLSAAGAFASPLAESIHAVCDESIEEATLEEFVTSLQAVWNRLELQLKPYQPTRMRPSDRPGSQASAMRAMSTKNAMHAMSREEGCTRGRNRGTNNM